MIHRARGFTLIELIIVVGVFSVVAIVIMPALLSRLHAAEEVPPSRPGAVEVDGGELRALPESPGVLPIYEAADVDVRLTADHPRVGRRVYTRYDAQVRGTFTLRAPRDMEGPVSLEFPLPEGATEAESFRLTFEGAGYSGEAEPEDLTLSARGITWSGPVPRPGADPAVGPLRAVLEYHAKGRERFVYRLPPARSTSGVEVRLTLVDLPRLETPEASLAPKSVDDERIVWSYENLFSDRPIIVELPGTESPIGRVMLLFKLVGVAVLLFGAGFWYLSEIYQPGCLDGFRLGHFMLLALTYSLFFVAFSVLGFQGIGTPLSLAVSVALALPLLVLHVATVMDRRFAVLYALPLAAFTVGMVVNGVYGGRLRDRVFIGGAFVTIAFLTLTHERFARQRAALLENREAEAQKRVESLRTAVEEASELRGRAGEVLSPPGPPGSEAARLRAEAVLTKLPDQIKAWWELNEATERMAADRDVPSRASLCRMIESKVRPLLVSLPRNRDALRLALEQLVEARDTAAQKAEAETTTRRATVHCTSCGHGWGGSPFCPRCGTKRAYNQECAGCGASLVVPLDLLDPERGFQKVHCHLCGEAYALATVPPDSGPFAWIPT